MNDKDLYITIVMKEEKDMMRMPRPGEKILLKKDFMNEYDDEAIAAYNLHKVRFGYVANSVYTVARGTHSAGYIYRDLKDEGTARVCFSLEGKIIARILSSDHSD